MFDNRSPTLQIRKIGVDSKKVMIALGRSAEEAA